MKASILVKFESDDANVEKIDHALTALQIKSIELIMGPYNAIVTKEH